MRSGPPSHLRVRLGVTLKNARRALKLTQVEAGARAGASQTQLTKIENALVDWIDEDLLLRLFDLYRLPANVQAELRGFAAHPYYGGDTHFDLTSGALWWQTQEGLEIKAEQINIYRLQAVDAMVQSPEYAHRQAELAGDKNPVALVGKRMARQAALLPENPSQEMLQKIPSVTVILDQGCLLTDMGEPAVMVSQLRYLLDLSERPNLRLLIRPFDAAVDAFSCSWMHLTFRANLMREFVCVPVAIGSATIDADGDLEVFRNRWSRLGALPPADSRRLIERQLGVHSKKVKGAAGGTRPTTGRPRKAGLVQVKQK